MRDGRKQKMDIHTGAMYALRVARSKNAQGWDVQLAVQHVECSKDQTETKSWQCDNCRPENKSTEVLSGTGRHNAQNQAMIAGIGKGQLGDALNESPQSRSRSTEQWRYQS